MIGDLEFGGKGRCYTGMWIFLGVLFSPGTLQHREEWSSLFVVMPTSLG